MRAKHRKKAKPSAWERHLRRAEVIKARNLDAEDLEVVSLTLVVTYGLVQLGEDGLIHCNWSISPEGRAVAEQLDRRGFGRRDDQISNVARILDHMLEGVVPLTPAGLFTIQNLDPNGSIDSIRDVLLTLLQISLQHANAQ